ncbi:hypothetical protein DDE84_07285 [Bifidobacterium tibiigranuli]|uniref:Uncharacterized protein n=1 Tax=Bifidobacterium tibiigranuli TaxID=2172043 RepID=A0A5N6RY00_9BIFI|nr:hypothetical protein DDF78_11575 [Bifidobacterium tibiigranuli]KAE8127720.1 hypothetical protein DDE84_07285 [Bifidobacterium tibiigranuli]
MVPIIAHDTKNNIIDSSTIPLASAQRIRFSDFDRTRGFPIAMASPCNFRPESDKHACGAFVARVRSLMQERPFRGRAHIDHASVGEFLPFPLLIYYHVPATTFDLFI